MKISRRPADIDWPEFPRGSFQVQPFWRKPESKVSSKVTLPEPPTCASWVSDDTSKATEEAKVLKILESELTRKKKKSKVELELSDRSEKEKFTGIRKTETPELFL